MDGIIIQGGRQLTGIIDINGAKNSALPALAATLLTKEPVTLHNIPWILDIMTMQELLAYHGAKIANSGLLPNSFVIHNPDLQIFKSPPEIVKKLRGSIWILAPLLARLGEAKIPTPGGCTIGDRLIDIHLAVLQALGAEINIEDNYIIARTAGHLRANDFYFPKISVGATITGILAAVLARGTSQFSNCAIEPEIMDLCQLLRKMGARIIVEERVITIQGCDMLHGAEHRITFDRIEAGTYLIIAGMTNGQLRLNNINNYNNIRKVCELLTEVGLSIEVGENYLLAKGTGRLQSINLATAPFPGFATDLQAQFMALMTIASGKSIITENLFENRLKHALELQKLGAQITIDSINTATVTGVSRLRGTDVFASDLRGAAALVSAALAIEGETRIHDVHHLDRGYQGLEQKLRNCGAIIQRVTI